MSPGDVISQLDAMNSNLERASSNIAQVLNVISEFEGTANIMVSESYDNIRMYYRSLHIPFLHGLTMYIESMKQENNVYKRCIAGHLAGIGYINEDELEKDKESIECQINYVYKLMSTTGLYSDYISALEHTLKLIKKKLKQISDFKGVSSGLYQGMENYKKCIKGGLNEIGSKHFDEVTGKYRLHRINLKWKKELKHVLVRNKVIIGQEQTNSTYDKRVEALCLEYLKTNMPQLLEVKFVPGMSSIEIEKQRRILEEKYVEELRRCLMEEEPWIINSYIMGSGVPSSVREIFEKKIEEWFSKIYFTVDKKEGNLELHKIENTYYIRNQEILLQIESIDPKYEEELEHFKELYYLFEDEYESISMETGVPPQLIAAIHYHENSADFDWYNKTINFSVYLHNGNPLGVETTDEPKNIYFGEDQFKEAAIDALEGKSWSEVENTESERFKSQNQSAYNGTGVNQGNQSMAAMLTFAEYYNGASKEMISTYVYNGALNDVGENIAGEGKFTSDHIYDSDAKNEQPGIYLLLNSIYE